MFKRLGGLIVIFPVIVGSTPIAGGDSPNERPWEWTAEDRIRERYDPKGIERRRRAAESEKHGGVPIAPGFQVIDGRYDPELFFEWELFDALLARGFGPEPRAREIFREQIEANLSAVDGFEVPTALWQRLEATAEDLLASRYAQLALAARLPGSSAAEGDEILAEIEALQEDGCQMRRITSLAAEKELGRRTLLRILYEGVAPDTFLQESTAQGRGDILLYVQQGCP